MLYNRVRQIREAHGLSQPQLAERAGVSNRVLTGLENDPGYRPSFTVAEHLCRYFDVSLGHLFFFDWEHAPRPAADSEHPEAEAQGLPDPFPPVYGPPPATDEERQPSEVALVVEVA